MAIREYKCANCGGAVSYDYGGGNIKCAHCGSAFEISEFEARQKNFADDIAGGIKNISA